MPIEKAQVSTGIICPDLQRVITVPVFYTDELLETSVYDMAYSSIIGGYLPYLFVGFFTDGKDFNKWFFANARRHEEMREAIESNIGKGYDYIYGQINFAPREMKNGRLCFSGLYLHSRLPDRQKAEKLLREVIKPELLREGFEIVENEY